MFTFLVVVGVALELWVIRDDWRDQMEAWALGHFGVIRLPGRPSLLKLRVEIASVLLITLGVAGELVVGIKIASINSQLRGKSAELRSKNADLRSKSDQLLALVTQQSGDAATSAKAAHEELDKVKTDAASLNKRLANTAEQLEAVESKRAELEKSLENLAICNAPRVVPAEVIFMPTGKLTATADPVRRFARQVSIEYVREPEAKRAALSLRLALEIVGWTVSAFTPIDELPDDGVEVEPFMPSWEVSSTTMWEEELDSWNAAEAVVEFLHSYNWQARIGWPINEKGEVIRDPKIFPPNSLRIKIGLYPPVVYISPSGAKEFSKAYEEFEKENKKLLAAIEPLEAEAEKKFFAQLTPKQAMVYKARQKHGAQIREQRVAQFSGPCQPLKPNPFPRL